MSVGYVKSLLIRVRWKYTIFSIIRKKRLKLETSCLVVNQSNQADLFCVSINHRLQSIHTVILFLICTVRFSTLSKNMSTATSHRISASLLPMAKRDESPSLLTNLHYKQPRTPLKLFP